MKKQKYIFAAALCAAASIAMANDVVSPAMQENLVAEQGYTKVAEGFFFKRVGTMESYMGLGSAGNHAMAQMLAEQRDASQRAIEARGGNAAEVIANYDRIIAGLSAPGPKVSASQTGDCLGTQGSPDFYVSAQASGGIYALSNARNDVGVINTTNYTNTWTVNRGGTITASQTTTTYGATPSSSTASISSSASACEAHAIASVKCPGYSNPSLSLFVTELKFLDCRN